MAIKKTISQKAMVSGLVMTFLLLFVSAFSFASELDEIRAAIKVKNAKWIAGETSVSKLPPEHRKLRLGLIKPKVTDAEKFISVETPLLGLSASLDWRHNPDNYVTSVRDQGNCGSCWAFATTGALESYTLIKDNSPGLDIDLAEQILVSCSRAGRCSGGYIDQASDFISDTGLPEESCYPYTATNGNCRKACNNWQLNTDRIDSWSYVPTTTTSPTVDAIKNDLYAYGPLVTTMDVYTDFFSYKSGIYSYTWGTYEGGHAVLIIGYDDTYQYFIAKNSWGNGWGEGGFFNIAYSQIGYPVEFGYWTIAYHQEATCTYSISPTNRSFTAAGGSETITVTTDTNCSWTAVSNASWITITSGSSGTGNGSVEYRVAPNRRKKTRTGTITVTGYLFTVKQDGL
jgi:C1A family cysteine protease